MAGRDPAGTVYELSGADGAPVVALVHGLGLNRHTWQWHLPALEPRYRMLNYDLFGHGESLPPPAIPSLALFAAQLRDLLDHLDVQACAVVGFSLGGMINRRFAIDHPTRVKALAILNSPHERGREAQALVEQRAGKSAAGGPGATLETTLERWFTPAFRATQGSTLERIRGWVLANDPVVYAQCRQVLAVGVLELIRPAPSIACPTLVMTCENDSGSTPAMAQAIAAEIAGARTQILPGLQHMGLVERPDDFTTPLLQFLDEVLADGGTTST